jgi:hypothetical protein
MKLAISVIFLWMTSLSSLHSQVSENWLTFFDFDSLKINNLQTVVSNQASMRIKWTSLPINYSNQIIYDQAPWFVGKINGEPILSILQWFKSWNYSPGPIINYEAAMLSNPEDSLRYRVYKISKGDDETNPDYDEWPTDFGAPLDENGNPLIKGDQTLWTLFNSLDSSAILTAAWNGPLKTSPIEIHQTAYSRVGNESDYTDIFSNIVFMEWEFINKSLFTIDSAYIGFWSDIDFYAADNKPAVDISRQLGYCWNEEDTTVWGDIPLAVGYSLLYGPIVQDPNSSAVYKGREISGFRNLTLSSFRGIADDSHTDSLTGRVRSMMDAHNQARGLTSNGYPIINPTNNLATKFPFSGDPLTGEGWIYNTWTSGGAGFVFFSGPFNMAPNDTQWIMIALIPALGSTGLNSIELLREKADLIRSLSYDSLAYGSISYSITDINENFNIIPENFSLSQNYPNPFNPSTSIQYAISSTQFVTLKVYDVLGNEVATLVNEHKPAGMYNVQFTMNNLASGIYFYRLTAGQFVQTKKMILIK